MWCDYVTFKDLVMNLVNLCKKSEQKQVLVNQDQFFINTIWRNGDGHQGGSGGLFSSPTDNWSSEEYGDHKNEEGIQIIVGPMKLCNTFTKWSNKLSFNTPHMTALTTKSVILKWEPVHSMEFNEVKKIISELAELAPYDISLPTKL